MKQRLSPSNFLGFSWNKVIVLLILLVVELPREFNIAKAVSEPFRQNLPINKDETSLNRNYALRQEPNLILSDPYLPDLQTLPPFDLRLVVNPRNRERVIRFSNSVWNRGRGRLELRGKYNDQNDTIQVTQVLYGFDQELQVRTIGEFVFHSIHNHWHWEGFSVYNVWTVESDGDLGEIVATSGKVGYCMMDNSRMDDEWLQKNPIPGLEITRRRFGECSWSRQGISTGWVDTYHSYIPGQEIDVSELRNGIYALRSTVNPGGLIFESNEMNNSAEVYFSLYGNRLHVIGEDPSDYLPPALMK